MLHDTPKITRILICVWLVMIHSVYLNTPLQASNNIKEIDKYKIYIHIKVMSYKEFVCINTLWSKENRSWNSNARNPKSSAYGIPQLLKLKERNPYVQIDLGYKYIMHRYKSPCNALAFHNKHGYY